MNETLNNFYSLVKYIKSNSYPEFIKTFMDNALTTENIDILHQNMNINETKEAFSIQSIYTAKEIRTICKSLMINLMTLMNMVKNSSNSKKFKKIQKKKGEDYLKIIVDDNIIPKTSENNGPKLNRKKHRYDNAIIDLTMPNKKNITNIEKENENNKKINVKDNKNKNEDFKNTQLEELNELDKQVKLKKEKLIELDKMFNEKIIKFKKGGEIDSNEIKPLSKPASIINDIITTPNPDNMVIEKEIKNDKANIEKSDIIKKEEATPYLEESEFTKYILKKNKNVVEGINLTSLMNRIFEEFKPIKFEFKQFANEFKFDIIQSLYPFFNINDNDQILRLLLCRGGIFPLDEYITILRKEMVKLINEDSGYQEILAKIPNIKSHLENLQREHGPVYLMLLNSFAVKYGLLIVHESIDEDLRVTIAVGESKSEEIIFLLMKEEQDLNNEQLNYDMFWDTKYKNIEINQNYHKKLTDLIIHETGGKI